MKQNTIRILLAAGTGFIFGWVCAQQTTRREDIEAIAANLRQHPPPATSTQKTQERQLKQMRSVLNDAHKRILAVSKGLQKPAA